MRPRLPIALALFLATASGLPATEDFEQEPINYSKSTPTDKAAEIQARIDNGTFEFDRSSGEKALLLSVLREFGVDPATQVLVFSQTSLQNDRISPRRPRALYFSDEAYIGWVQGGDVEVTTIDPKLGPVFYRLHVPRTPAERTRILRDGDCMRCHLGHNPDRVPGLLVRSVYPDADGQPIYSAGTFFTDHTSPLSERWGGWYVTGDHGPMRHMGNVIAEQLPDGRAKIDIERGANLSALPDFVDRDAYLQPDSDIVALMVLEHQLTAHNALFAAHFASTQTLHRNRLMAKHFSYSPDELSATSRRLLESQAERLLRVLLFADEFPLEGYGIEGNEAFQTAYAAGARRDSDGRSLRDLQLLSRLYKYRCSPLVYSSSFANLAPEFRAIVLEFLRHILDGEFPSAEQAAAFAHLKAPERARIKSILTQPLDNLPPNWNTPPPTPHVDG